MPASASIPRRTTSRPSTGRSRLRPVVFAILVALVPTGIVAWAVGRNEASDVRQTANAAVASEAQIGAREATRLLTRAGATAVDTARLPEIQRALARNDRAALAAFAHNHPAVSFLVRGHRVPAHVSAAAARRTAVVTLGGNTIGTVIVQVDRRRLTDAVRSVRVAGKDRLLLVDEGTAPPRGYRTAAVPISSRLDVVAARPVGTIDGDVRGVWLSVLAAALATLATVGVIAWGASPLVVRGRMAVRERSEALRVLSGVRDGVFLTDDDGVVRFWNRAAELITGLKRTDVWGRRLGDLPGLGTVADEIPVGEEGEVVPLTVPVQLGLAELWLSVAGVQTPEGTVYTFADITEEQRLEQLKNDFVATVSHELRTPLTGLYGAAVTLRERGDLIPPSARAQLLTAVGDQAELLARVIEDILVASGIESDQLLFAEHSFEGVALAQEVVEEARLRHSTTRVQLVQDEESLFVRADAVRTRQVLDNLIDNAVRYSERGPIWVAVESGEDMVVFSVADEGPGIPLDKHDRIFEKFYRSDVQMQGGVGGAGLGLYISRELVRRMGGRLWVDSTPGAGSLFSFELPALST